MARTTDPAPEESAPLVCPAPKPLVCPAPDPYAGQGGEYVLDMQTGIRTKTEKN